MDIASIIRFYAEIGNKLFRDYYLLARPLLDVFYFIFDNLFYLFLYITILVSLIYFIMSIYTLIKRPKSKEGEFIEGKAPFVTVQIPTYNELVALRCAKKSLEFDYPKNKFEIIIGDDSIDPFVSQKIDEFAKQYDQVKVTRRGENIGYKAGNLNHMLKHSRGDILVLFDSDFVPERDFLKRIVTPFLHDKSVSGVQARWKFIDQNKNFVSLLGSTILTVFHHICLPFVNKMLKVSFLCGSAEAVRKKDLIRLGGWKSGSLTEDIEYSLRLLKNKKRIVYLDGLECASEVPYKSKDLYKQQMRWAYGVIKSFREHFTTLYFSRKVGLKQKMGISFFCSGYLFSTLLIFLFSTGLLSFVTHPPAPINLTLFFSKLGINVLLTSGLIFSSILAMTMTKNIRKLPSMIAASFSVGLIVTYYVNIGIFKVFFNKPMKWFMLDKIGNKLKA